MCLYLLNLNKKNIKIIIDHNRYTLNMLELAQILRCILLQIVDMKNEVINA
jgi:hypothetical protein